MKNTLQEIFHQAKRFITDELNGNNHPSYDFQSSPHGRLAYELVLDASASMDDDDYPPTRFGAAKQAATGFLKKCEEQTPEALVGAIFYSDSAREAAPLLPVRGEYRQLRRAISSGRTGFTTNIGAGLTAAARAFKSIGPPVSPAIVLLTDGHSNEGPNPVGVARKLKNAGVRLDIVGIGGSPEDVNERQLKEMASIHEGQLRYWFIRDTDTLVQRFEAFALGKL
jgi:Mg-chelatase subunit ChlD